MQNKKDKIEEEIIDNEIKEFNEEIEKTSTNEIKDENILIEKKGKSRAKKGSKIKTEKKLNNNEIVEDKETNEKDIKTVNPDEKENDINIENNKKENKDNENNNSEKNNNKATIPEIIRYSAVDTINNVLKRINDEQEYKNTEKKVKKISIYDTEIFKAYKRRINNNKKDIVDNLVGFNPEKTIKVALMIILVFSVIFAIATIRTNSIERDRFTSISTKEDLLLSSKDNAVNNSLNKIRDKIDNNLVLKPDNLNLAFIYEDLEKKEEETENNPKPVSVVDVPHVTTPMDSVAGQVFNNLIYKYVEIKNAIFNMSSIKPINLVRGYKLSEKAVLGSYNPDDSSHKINKPNTFFVSNFSNVQIKYLNGDGEEIDEYSNIKDIISMASVYTYYHDPYNYELFSNYCDELFNISISFKPKTGPLYYCNGCMHYDEANSIIASESEFRKERTLSHIDKFPDEQKLKIANVKKTGIINRMDTDAIEVKEENLDDYIDTLDDISLDSYNNYCPGHIDLVVEVTLLTLDETNGLISVENVGNRGYNWTIDWHGWDLQKKSYAHRLSEKDWEEEYGISVSYINFLQPLTKPEIDYYLSRLDKNISKERYEVIKTALESVALIPYYYGGKTSKKGIKGNDFGTRVKADYKGRILKGLDCSGWVKWVYWTAIDDRKLGASTRDLAKAGKGIRRKDLQPGDIIVRPGYDSHVMMFYEWAEDGRMKVIHENGSVNNVSVAVVDGYYPYYRNLFEKEEKKK